MRCVNLALVVSLELCLLAGGVMKSAHAGEESLVVYYSDKANIDEFQHFQKLVLDSESHPPLQRLGEQGKQLLGYLSLGEIKRSSPYFQVLQKQGLVLQENANWKDSYTIDLRNPAWGKIVIGYVIPQILRSGFDGIFIDTLDSPLELERSSPQKYKGMNEAATNLIMAIRMHYPTMPLMVNRAYKILDKIAPSIDMELGESVYADYDFTHKTYGKVEPSLYHEQVSLLQQAKQTNPKLKIYTLDYSDAKNEQVIADIYRTQRKNGFIPYVATVELDKVIHEPVSK
jgi:uncharacterized protein (TIGR01370 family)